MDYEIIDIGPRSQYDGVHRQAIIRSTAGIKINVILKPHDPDHSQISVECMDDNFNDARIGFIMKGYIDIDFDQISAGDLFYDVPTT